MLAELEPSVDLTGGSWYTDNVMDVEFIDQLSNQIYKYIHAKSTPPNGSIYPAYHIPPTSTDEIHEWITKSGLTSHPLSVQDIQALIDRLIYDGSVYLSDEHYKSSFTRKQGTALTDSPCGTCPVFSFCKVGGPVSPDSCQYLMKWLEL